MLVRSLMKDSLLATLIWFSLILNLTKGDDGSQHNLDLHYIHNNSCDNLVDGFFTEYQFKDNYSNGINCGQNKGLKSCVGDEENFNWIKINKIGIKRMKRQPQCCYLSKRDADAAKIGSIIVCVVWGLIAIYGIYKYLNPEFEVQGVVYKRPNVQQSPLSPQIFIPGSPLPVQPPPGSLQLVPSSPKSPPLVQEILQAVKSSPAISMA